MSESSPTLVDLVDADRLSWVDPAASRRVLENIIELAPDLGVRAEGCAALAQLVASGRTAAALQEGTRYVQRADDLIQEAIKRGRSLADDAESSAQGGQHASSEESPENQSVTDARARTELARGYIAFRQSNDIDALHSLDKAASLSMHTPRIRGRVFDVLGMLLSRRGDLDTAHDYYCAAVRIKEESEADKASLALTYGNLGRLELQREKYKDAENWLKKDLDMIVASKATPAIEAHVRNQLAQAIAGQGPMRHLDVKNELSRARSLAPEGSITLLFILKELFLLSLSESKAKEATKWFEELVRVRKSVEFPEFEPWFHYLEGKLVLSQSSDDHGKAAIEPLRSAWVGFLSRSMPTEASDVALELADIYVRTGQTKKAVEILEQTRQHLDAASVTRRETLIAKIEAKLGSVSDQGMFTAIRGRFSRMIGSTMDSWFLAAPKQQAPVAPPNLTVLVCELRGLDQFWSVSSDVATSRVLRLVGLVIDGLAELGATVDRMAPDRLIVHFEGHGAEQKAPRAAKLIQDRLSDFGAERCALGEKPLLAAIGIATSWANHVEVTGAGRTERVLVGPAVTLAARAASLAKDGEIRRG